eukprot:TRINITY_DN20619_c0_g2_i1.p1 TRINITY_DN20619_c0_g2~~TRINITY_DN20619_c0_g2_i1.p1  ORF type:complete len:468 (-),score=13.42 TRINITY_DN20619_c0_g2_i1:572-1975(-)
MSLTDSFLDAIIFFLPAESVTSLCQACPHVNVRVSGSSYWEHVGHMIVGKDIKLQRKGEWIGVCRDAARMDCFRWWTPHVDSTQHGFQITSFTGCIRLPCRSAMFFGPYDAFRNIAILDARGPSHRWQWRFGHLNESIRQTDIGRILIPLGNEHLLAFGVQPENPHHTVFGAATMISHTEQQCGLHQHIELSGEAPCPRASAMIMHVGACLYVFGGSSVSSMDGCISHRDTYRLDLSARRWNKFVVDDWFSPDVHMHPIHWARVGSSLLLLSLHTSKKRTSSIAVHRFCMRACRWIPTTVLGRGPSRQAQHHLCLNYAGGSKVLVFADNTKRHPVEISFHKAWSLDMNTLHWHDLDILESSRAPPLHAHPQTALVGCPYMHGNLVVFHSASSQVSCHVLSLKCMRWQVARQDGLLPRFGCQGTVMLNLGFQLLFLGGLASYAAETTTVPLHVCELFCNFDIGESTCG